MRRSSSVITANDPERTSACDLVVKHGPLDLMFSTGRECGGSQYVFAKLRQGMAPFVATTQRPEYIVRFELECETQLPNVFVLSVLAHDDLPRQVERKLLTRSPVVRPPLKKKHIRIFMVLEYTFAWPLVPVEIEKRLTPVDQVKVTLMQVLAAQDCLEFLACILWLKHRGISFPLRTSRLWLVAEMVIGASDACFRET
jgi:hypothetical protein